MKVSLKTSGIVLTLVAVFAVVAALYTPTWRNWEGYGDVSVAEAIELLNDKPDMVILDVRTPEEYEEGHIEGAINIHVQELSDRLGELSKSHEMLIYCRIGNRSGVAVETLKENGVSKIYHMYEGIQEWGNLGHPIVQ